MKYTIYDPTTGAIQYTFTSADARMVEINLAGQSWIPGEYSSAEYYIDNAQPVAMPAAPAVPGQVFVFDYASKTWQLDHDRSSTASRQLRNQLLATVDQINPVWYASLTAEQQQDLIVYRQTLLDVPQQPGFPSLVNWPTAPSWL